MVDFTKIVQKSFGDEDSKNKQKKDKKNKVELKEENGPLDDLFGKPEEKKVKGANSSSYSKTLGNLFGVEEEE